MTWIGRRTGVAALAVFSLCMGLTGCVQMDGYRPPVRSALFGPGWTPQPTPAGTQPAVAQGGAALAPPRNPNEPPGNAVVQTQQPNAVVQTQAVMPGAPGAQVMPGQVMQGNPTTFGAPVMMAQTGEPGGEFIDGGGGPGCASCGHGLRGGLGGRLFGPRAVDSVGTNNCNCPHELDKVSHPPYRMAPPDILYIDAIRMIPKGPYRLEPMEILQITVADKLPNEPISGNFMIGPEGSINLGYNYGSVRVGGLTLDEAQIAIRDHLGKILKSPSVSVALIQFRGMQQIRGEHLVRPDGTISLGTYGSVYVAGMTLGQIKCELEKYLCAYLVNPNISIDVLSYNSQKIYVIMDGGGFGQQIIPLPVTGNETVLDAISRVYGLSPISSKHRIWVARPSPCNLGCNQVLPVDWNAITQGGSTPTNYQLFPGDRVYVSANRLIAFDNYLSQVLAPVERIFGITLLGQSVVRGFSSNANNNGGVFVPVVR